MFKAQHLQALLVSGLAGTSSSSSSNKKSSKKNIGLNQYNHQQATIEQKTKLNILANVIKNGDINSNIEHRLKSNQNNKSTKGEALEEEQEVVEKSQEQQANGFATIKRINNTTSKLNSANNTQANFEGGIVWFNVSLFIVLHSMLAGAVYLLLTRNFQWKTLLYSLVLMYASALGVTGGAHRLWSHRAYKAKWPVQVLLMLLQTMAGQNSIYTWCRDHRVHHKFSETNADPHNIKRGFFFAHMGWLCTRKHPDVKEKGKLIDMSDLEANPIVMFQHRHFWWLATTFTVLLPTLIPTLLWAENIYASFALGFVLRYAAVLHLTWCVNSVAHWAGHRPYDKRIEARESPPFILIGMGEFFHNYHHTFPYDYAAGEFGKYMNITTAFIDWCASLGLAYDRRTADRETIYKRRQRTGDGTDNEPTRATIDEKEEQAAPANHELPYISGLTSMKYTI